MRAIAGVLLAGGAAGAWGQEPKAITAMRADARYHAAAEGLFLKYEAGLTTHCGDVKVDWTRASYQLYGPVVLDAEGLLSDASWVEAAPGKACGESRRYQTFVRIRGGRAAMEPLLPGESYAGPTLEKDARGVMSIGAAAHIRKADAHCQMDVLDTNIVGHARPKPHEVWEEVWLVRMCDRTMNVPIKFIPDDTGGGTTFSFSPGKITDVP